MRLKTSTVVGFSLASAAIAVVLILRLIVFNGFTTSWGEHIKNNERYLHIVDQTLTQSDLEHIAQMRRLGHLELENCNVAECRLPELSFASKDLYYVSFEGTTGLWDTSFLSTLSAPSLNLNGCTSVDSISGLNWEVLEDLYIDDTSVSDLSPARGSGLVYLSFARTDVSDLSPLASCEELYEVDGPYTKVTSLDALADTPWLIRLNFDGCELENPTRSFVSPILHEVNLANTGISDLSFLASCEELELVNVAGNPKIDDFSWLNPNAKEVLRELNVSRTGLDASDLSTAASCTRLERLALDGIELGNLDLCKRLAGLEELSAVGCGLTDIQGIKNLKELTILLLGYNEIEDISCLPTPPDDWPQMELDLSHNKLTSLADLPKGKYRFLMLHGNGPDVARTIPAGIEVYQVTVSWFSGIEDSRLSNFSSFSQIYLFDCPEDEVASVEKYFPTYRLERVDDARLADLLENNGMGYSLSGDYSSYISRIREGDD